MAPTSGSPNGLERLTAADFRAMTVVELRKVEIHARMFVDNIERHEISEVDAEERREWLKAIQQVLQEKRNGQPTTKAPLPQQIDEPPAYAEVYPDAPLPSQADLDAKTLDELEKLQYALMYRGKKYKQEAHDAPTPEAKEIRTEKFRALVECQQAIHAKSNYLTTTKAVPFNFTYSQISDINYDRVLRHEKTAWEKSKRLHIGLAVEKDASKLKHLTTELWKCQKTLQHLAERKKKIEAENDAAKLFDFDFTYAEIREMEISEVKKHEATAVENIKVVERNFAREKNASKKVDIASELDCWKGSLKIIRSILLEHREVEKIINSERMGDTSTDVDSGQDAGVDTNNADGSKKKKKNKRRRKKKKNMVTVANVPEEEDESDGTFRGSDATDSSVDEEGQDKEPSDKNCEDAVDASEQKADAGGDTLQTAVAPEFILARPITFKQHLEERCSILSHTRRYLEDDLQDDTMRSSKKRMNVARRAKIRERIAAKKAEESEVLLQIEMIDRPGAVEEVNPEVNPEVKPEVNPEVRPEVNPEVRPEVNPEVNPEVKPEITVTPGDTPEDTPLDTPEVAPTDPTTLPSLELNEGYFTSSPNDNQAEAIQAVKGTQNPPEEEVDTSWIILVNEGFQEVYVPPVTDDGAAPAQLKFITSAATGTIVDDDEEVDTRWIILASEEGFLAEVVQAGKDTGAPQEQQEWLDNVD